MYGVSQPIRTRLSWLVSNNRVFTQAIHMDKKAEIETLSKTNDSGDNIASRTRSSVRKLSTTSSGADKSGDSPEDKMPYIVGHNKKLKEFYIKLQDGENISKEKAILQYEYIRKNLVDLYHTEVPPVFRGHGIAKLLAEAAFDHFVSEDVTMKLTCTYLQHYAESNPVPRIWSKLYSGD